MDSNVYDEHQWITELHDKLKVMIEKSLEGLSDYLKCFDVYKEVLKIRPDEYIKKLETEEKPREIEVIRDEVLDFMEKEKKLKEAMPESVQVGYFRVNCKEIAALLAGKYLLLSKGLIDLIAKRAKSITLKLYDDIQEIKLKINEPPKDIEKLSDIKEYMN